MCGIIGYIGEQPAGKIIFDGLKKMEYRGYDSAGIATFDGKLFIKKGVGKISEINEKTSFSDLPGKIGVGHTRWATHGKVTIENAHPHTDCNKEFVVVHNGIIENFLELKKELLAKGHKFKSETDTEVIPHLIEEFKENDFAEAIKKTIAKLKGRFAIIAIKKDSEEIVGARRGSPLVLGVGNNEFFLASDIPAFLKHTNKVIFLDDNEMVILNKNFKVLNFETGQEIEKKISTIDWSAEEAEKGDFEHFMLKEILEQRETIARAINQDDRVIEEIAEQINKAKGTFFVGCGTAGKVALTGTYLFSRIANKHVNFTVASEFPNYQHFLNEETLMISISQSGETADTLEAIETAKKKGVSVVSIVNVFGSTMTRLSDNFLLTNSGPEKCVASTKVTTAQLAIVTLLAYACAGKLEEGKKLLRKTAIEVSKMLDNNYLKKIHELAKKLKDWESMYVIGRSLNYPIALESAIKIQEIPYVHAEGFAGGELKHGPIALIEKGTPTIVLVANDETKSDILSNAMEIKSRGGFIIGIAPENNEVFDFHIKVPDAGNTSPIVNIIPVQLLSYYLALERGCDIDHPRNLAKSVTVK